MQLAFHNSGQESVFRALKRELNTLGYRGELLQPGYGFRDWFAPGTTPRVAPLAAFGRTPVSYDNACAVVLLANGTQGPSLLRDFRALGAPLAFEVHDDRVVEWRVALEPSLDDFRSEIPADALSQVFAEKKGMWGPQAVLRAKNIGPTAPVQFDFFDLGLIPALEDNIRTKLDPLLRNVLADAQDDYRRRTPALLDPRALFRLAVWSLAGKVFHDRGIGPFSEFTHTSDPDEILKAVADYYCESQNGLLLKQTRRIVHQQIWTKLDFSNISVDVLAQIWLKTFVTQDVRDKLGIHQTPRSVARYVLERLPVEAAVAAKRPIIEPCCGSGTFLIAALHRLRDLLPASWNARQRHAAMKRLLIGYEADPFAVEISRLSLTLADFPNPDGWQLNEADVFESEEFDQAISKSGLVVCNPPYGDFTGEDREKYAVKQVHRPSELLRRVLDHLPRDSSIGFVLPQRFLDGQSYRDIRGKIVDRWASIEVVDLPEAAFPTADQETILLIATEPKVSTERATTVAQWRILRSEWPSFEARFHAKRSDNIPKTKAEATASLAVRELAALWEAIKDAPLLATLADIHRGIEWKERLQKDRQETGARARLVQAAPKDGYKEGYPPKSDVSQFLRPPTSFLSVQKDDQLYDAFSLPWDLPKVFVNAVRKSRGRWPVAAFADERPLLCYQNLTAVWPKDPEHLYAIAAALNGPIANAFVATIEAKRHVRIATLELIPMPHFEVLDLEMLKGLIADFQHHATVGTDNGERSAVILREIDANVLKGYNIPAQLEKDLLRWFDGFQRAVPSKFNAYFPPYVEESGLSLKEFVDMETRWCTLNERRLDLIELEVARSIESVEAEELERLQLIADVKFRPLHQEAMRRLDLEVSKKGW